MKKRPYKLAVLTVLAVLFLLPAISRAGWSLFLGVGHRMGVHHVKSYVWTRTSRPCHVCTMPFGHHHRHIWRRHHPAGVGCGHGCTVVEVRRSPAVIFERLGGHCDTVTVVKKVKIIRW